MPVRGSKEWAPLDRRLRKRTVETPVSIDDDSKLGAAAFVVDDRGGPLGAWHVTDEPNVLPRALSEGEDLRRLRPHQGDCGGLMVSNAPQLYARGAERQWDFLQDLIESQRIQLADLISQEAKEKGGSGYISKSEMDRVFDNVDHWLKTGNDVFLRTISGQPFNINIQTLSKQHEIGEPQFPKKIPVVFEGRYLDMTDHFEDDPILRQKAAEFSGISEEMLDIEDICRALAAWGYDGIFTKSGMADYPGLTIWNGDRILQYGDWKP